MRWTVTALALASSILLPSNAGAQRVGQLISADPVTDTPAGMQAWRVAYWTSSGRGRPVRVTGMVVAPREAMPARPRNVLAWTHGTWGVTPKCAPSLSPNFWSATAGLEGVRRGMVVVAPDYPGLGSNDGAHPFLIGIDTGQSVLDGVRAARDIPGAAAGRRFAVWGESQGGHAALWSGQLARGYAPDLELVGVAAAAPPTDLVANLRQAPNRTTRAFFTAFIGYSWSAHYGIPLSSLGARMTQGLIRGLADKCISLDSKPQLSTIAGIFALQANLRNIDLGARQPWASHARANSAAPRPFGVPLLIAQNPTDDLVAPAVTRAFVRAQCRAGARLRFISIAGSGHATSAKDSAAATLNWIGDRFAGRAAPSDCASL